MTALAASSLATCSRVRFQPTAPRFSRSCCSLRAPMMTVATVGRCSSQLRAICGTVLPVSRGDLVDGVDDLVDIVVRDRRPNVDVTACCWSRLVSGSGWPRRILPVSRPQPSGLQTTAPTFWSSASGISSHS